MLKKGRCKISCSKVKHRSLSALLVITVRRMSVTYEPSKMVVSEQVCYESHTSSVVRVSDKCYIASFTFDACS